MKLWGGRFEKNSSSAMDAFHSSIAFDSRMAKNDIEGSMAHVMMLGKQNIIPASIAQNIRLGLQGLLKDLHDEKLEFAIEAEDIHMNIETLLIERIGEDGKHLHTGRSRNDQVALDMRLYMKDEISHTISLLTELESALVLTAKKHIKTVMPGYTHLQKAQPITLAHHILAYAQMFKRDILRMQDCLARMDECPLGSGALATSTYPIDRTYTAELLGFARICENSMDAVSDRDYCIEFCSNASIAMMHLSRFCEELVLWSSDEFQFIEIDDAYATGSSIMPQKKNPDAAELIRGKTGRVYGDLMALLTVMKGIPLAYNKDMQEDKEATFDALDTLQACLSIFTKMFESITFREKTMRESASRGFTNATDAADFLVKNGVSFRDAHEIIGKIVLDCIKKNVAISDLSLEDLKLYNEQFTPAIYDAVSLDICVNERKVAGGPAKESIKKQIKNIELFLRDNSF